MTFPFQSIGALLADHALSHPGKIAIFDLESDKGMNFAELRDAVVLENGELDTHCRTILPHVKTPKRFITVTELPKSDREKIRRDALKELWARHEKQGSQ